MQTEHSLNAKQNLTHVISSRVLVQRLYALVKLDVNDSAIARECVVLGVSAQREMQ